MPAIVRECDIWALAVGKWRDRFLGQGLDVLTDAQRPIQPRRISGAEVKEAIQATLQEPRPATDTRWTTRSMDVKAGICQPRIFEICQTLGLKPHRVETWKLSKETRVGRQSARRCAPVYGTTAQRLGVMCGCKVLDSGAGSQGTSFINHSGHSCVQDT